MINRELDQFFTTKEIAQKCLGFLSLHVELDKVNWFEPSAGAGVFLEVANHFNMNMPLLACDLMVQHKDVIEADFLNLPLIQYVDGKDNILCLGNPPFGKNSSLAIKFFNHAAKNSDMIAMIFPATFAKDSVKRKLDLRFHLIAELDLGKIDFDFMGEYRKVPVVFQVWRKEKVYRELVKLKLTSHLFDFVVKEEANFAIQRVGAAAGKVKLNLEKLSPCSHYFIRAIDKRVFDVFSKIDWNLIKNKTAGNPSIAKTELIEELERNIKN